VENGIVSEEKHKPVLDEQTLAKLLEAAYVLQEHNREVRELELGLDLKRDQLEAEAKAKSAPVPETPKPREPEQAAPGDYTFTLAQIVATQHQIQIRNLGLEKAMSLVAERVIDIARASGAAIGILDGNKIRYRAVAGSKTLRAGTEIPTERALCLPCIRNGQVFRCADVDPEFLIDAQECRRRGIASLIAVPIFHEGVVAGGLELYYGNQNGFSEQDIHTGQLMAGLVTEALARDEELTWKQSLASERAVMLEALEKLKPNLSALVDTTPPREAAKTATATEGYTCAKCGHKLMGGEQFCGQCGTPRSAGARNNGAQLSPIPDVKAPAEVPRITIVPVNEVENPAPVVAESLPESIEEQFPDLFAVPKPAVAETKELAEPVAEPVKQDLSGEVKADLEDALNPEEENAQPETDSESEKVALAKLTHPADWSSAATARDFLEELANGKPRGALAGFWNARRGDIYLAIAVILVACVIRWGIWSNHSVGATAAPGSAAATNHRKAAPAPEPELSLMDRMLISLGLAETPEVPEEKGNPSTQVWVDLRTALYYCPGTDLYGKTPKGKYTSQRDAQLDQYEPAYRKACD
jgi:GAF domain-containing protein